MSAAGPSQGASPDSIASDGHASAGLLALIEASDRYGAALTRLGVTRWPVRIGRALDCDLVISQEQVAPQHMALEPYAAGGVRVRLLGQRNGAVLEDRAYRAGEEFVWQPGQELWLGRVRLTLRLSDTPLEPEVPMAESGRPQYARSGALLGALLAMSVLMAWLDVREPERFAQTMPLLVLGLAGTVALWSAAWALMSKLFTGRPQYLRHLGIACGALLLAQCLSAGLNLLGFMFSWELLGRFENQFPSLVLAGGLWLHARVLAPHRSRALGLAIGALAALSLLTVLGSQWLQNKRLSNQLYMSALFPPQLRVAEPVPAAQFVDELRTLRARLEQRIKDSPFDAAAAGDSESED